MADLLQSLPYVIQNEGTGYSEPPETDQPTNTGIIAQDVATYRKVPLSAITIDIMKSLTQMEITEIYRTLYWNPLSLDQIVDQRVATCIFDTGVNRGIRIAALYAQKVCNGHGINIAVDGMIGPESITGINLMDYDVFISQFEALEMAGYEAILAANPQDEIYRNGWEARAKRLLVLI